MNLTSIKNVQNANNFKIWIQGSLGKNARKKVQSGITPGSYGITKCRGKHRESGEKV